MQMKGNKKSILSEMPWDTAEYLLKNHILHGIFEKYRRVVINVPEWIKSERMRFLYTDRVPCSGQEITVDRLDIYMDSALLPPYREYFTRVFEPYITESINPPITSLTKHQQGAILHAEALGLITKPGVQIAQQQPFDAADFAKVCGEHIGTRHALQYVKSSNKAICTVRAVCKTYAKLFNDYVFRPVVEFDGDASKSGVHIASPGSLRGAAPRDVRPTNKPQTLHVYFARKAIRVDTGTGEVTEWWQYINPALMTIGCNAVVITCETEPDASGRVIQFPAAQPVTRNGRFTVQSKQRHWEQTAHPNLGHHLQAESLANESVYSIHPGTRWEERLHAKNSKMVCVWDCKFDHKWKTSTRRVAVSQSFTMSARCAQTSASLCIEKTDPLRAVRFRVAFGIVPRTSTCFRDAGEDDIVQFEASEMSAFRECVSATSEYFYASTISLDPEAVTKRAEKRKVRTENELQDRRSAAAARRSS